MPAEQGVVLDPFSTKGPLGPRVVRKPTSSPPSLEIWFVHGLTGNRERTFTHQNNTYFPDLIADEFSAARVVTYGYDADVVKFGKAWRNADSSGLQGYGEVLATAVRDSRQGPGAVPDLPIYFIAHSLGGLVVEKALLIGLEDTELSDIATHTKGIFFMGTPHRGAQLANWGSIFRKLIPAVIRSTNKQILEILKTKSTVLKELEDSFQKQAKHYRLKHIRLHCFYETVLMPGFTQEIVPQASAVLPAEHSTAITRTHVEMVTFEGANDSEYMKVKGQLTRWFAGSPEPQGGVVDEPQKKPAATSGKHNGGLSVTGPTFNHVYGGTINNTHNTAGRDLIQANDQASQHWVYNMYGGEESDSDDEEFKGIGGEDTPEQSEPENIE